MSQALECISPKFSTFASRPKIIGTSSGCNNLVTSCPGAYQKMTFIVRFAVPPQTSTSCRITYTTTRRKRNKWWTWGRQDKELVGQEIVIAITQFLWIIMTIESVILGWSGDLRTSATFAGMEGEGASICFTWWQERVQYANDITAQWYFNFYFNIRNVMFRPDNPLY